MDWLKSQISSTKSQKNPKFQAPNHKHLEFGIWNLFVICNLLFGILLLPQAVQAAAYTASDCVGQVAGDGTCVFTTSTGGTTSTTLQGVNGVAVDNTNNRLFVADRANNRILVFNINADGTLPNRTADAVLGQANFTSAGNGTTAATLFSPGGLAYDSGNNRLYVADTNNNRVLVYDVATIDNGEAAANVLGQADFTSGGFGTTIATMRTPGSVAYASNLLYVADAGNSRILVFNVAAIDNGEAAANVLGQADFTSSAGATTQAGLSGANGVALDTTNNRLFAADGGNSRIVSFDVRSAGSANSTACGTTTTGIANGMNASCVLGQSDFITGTSGTTQSKLQGPTGITYDSVNSRLIAADTTNNRVMIFDVAAITNGENAVKVLGQANYTSSTAATTQAGQSTTTSVAIDTTNARLWVGDSANRRVLLYNFIRITTTSPMTAGEVNTAYSQTVATTASQGTVTFSTTAGSLPTALSIGASTGTISGTPTTAATSNFTTRSCDDDTDTGGVCDDQALAITIAADSTGPVISSVASSGVTSSGATITWTTNEAGSSQVQYSTDLSYGSSTTEADTSPRVTSHSVAVTGLSAGTTYNYRVRSCDAASNCTNSTNNTLTTSAAASGGSNVAINPPPGKPTALNVSCIGGATSTCTVSWTDPPDNDLARIEVWRNDGTGTAVTGPRAFVNPGVGSYKDTDGLVVGKTYTYQLVAVDNASSKNASEEVSGTISATAEPAPTTITPKVEDTTPKPKLELTIEVKVVSPLTPTLSHQGRGGIPISSLSLDGRGQGEGATTSSIAFALALSSLLLFSVLLHGHHDGKQGPMGFFALFPLLLTSSHNSYMYLQRCGPESCRGRHFTTHRALKHGARVSFAATAVAGAVKLVLAVVLTSSVPSTDIFAQQVSAKPGDMVAAGVTLKNTSTVKATNIQLSIPIPGGCSFSALTVNTVPSTLTPIQGTLLIPFADLLPTAIHTTELRCKVENAPPAALSFSASATASETGTTVFKSTSPASLPVVIPPQIPVAPTNLTASRDSTDQVVLTWQDTSLDETGFKIERSTTDETQGFTEIGQVTVDTSTWTDSSALTPKTSYYYRVRSFNVSGSSAYSNVVAPPALPPPPPAAPTDFKATFVAPASVELIWQDTTDETSYVLERAEEPAEFVELTRLPADTVKFKDGTDIVPNRTYQYKLYAVGEGGNSPALTATLTIPRLKLVPKAPGELQAQALGEEQIQLTWQDRSNNETNFELERATDAAGFKQLTRLEANTITFLDQASGLKAGTNYQYRIRSVNNEGTSEYSNVVGVLTLGIRLQAPVAPTDLTAEVVQEGVTLLHWKDNSDNETGFVIEKSSDQGQMFFVVGSVLVDISSFQYVAPNAPDVIFVYRVKAENSAGVSESSNVVPAEWKVPPPKDVVEQPPVEVSPAPEVTNVELIFNQQDFTVATGGGGAALPGEVPVTAVLQGTAPANVDHIEVVFESDPIVLAFVPEGPTWQYVAQATLPVGTHTMSVFAIDRSGVRTPMAAPVQFEVTLPQCFDGVDNDRDGFQDHPDDPGCESRADNDEADPVTAVVETVVEKILAPIISEETAQKAVEAVSKTVATVQKSKTYKTIDKQVVNNPKVEQVNETVAAPVVVAVAAANTATAASAPTLLIYLRYLITQPLLLFTRRRRKAWGTVYSSLAKMPVDLALVRLMDVASGRLLGTRVTDRQGRYMFLTDPGKYRLEVTKANYAFPSQFLAGKKEDVEYKGLYHGEPIPVASARTTITPPVPVDPAQKEETPADVLARARKMKLQRAGALAGPILSVASLIISPTMGMVGAAAGQLALLGLFNRLAQGRKPKSWGKVVDANGQPLAQTICRIFDSQFNKLLETQVTDKYGRYAFLVGKGQFYITVDKQGYGQYKSEVLNLSGGMVKKDVALKKA